VTSRTVLRSLGCRMPYWDFRLSFRSSLPQGFVSSIKQMLISESYIYRKPTSPRTGHHHNHHPHRCPMVHIQLSDPIRRSIRRSQVRDGPPRAGAGGDVAELQGGEQDL
jgi:hypothetical protein